jgi:hypothetical protein
MQLAEGLVLLRDSPSFFIVKTHIYVVQSVGPMVLRVINHNLIPNKTVDLHQEEVRPAEVLHILGASLNMFKESFSGVKAVAKLALRCHAVFEALAKGFEFLILIHKFIILHFLLGYSLCKHCVGLSQLFYRLLVILRSHGLALLLLDGGHQLMVHLAILFKLLLSEL